MNSPVVSNTTDTQTRKLIRSLLSKYMRKSKQKQEGVMIDPSGATNWITEGLKSKYGIEVPNLKLKIVHMLAEEELNL